MNKLKLKKLHQLHAGACPAGYDDLDGTGTKCWKWTAATLTAPPCGNYYPNLHYVREPPTATSFPLPAYTGVGVPGCTTQTPDGQTHRAGYPSCGN